MMKKLFLVLIFCLIGQVSLTAAGGPDAYGYTWLTSADPGGPAVQFIDISGYGTLVTGLADDNSAPGMVNIGFPFHYYWNDYTQMKIGSNGWASFSNTSNIASCFPIIPSTSAPNDYLALLMGDLNFTGAGNPGQVYTYTNNVDTFIIMYKNVPFWMVSAPGYTGSNSFEVILCKSDSSITFQYGNLSGFQPNAACVDLTVGIENSTGAIGLQVHSDAMPPSNYAIKFKYPPVVLLSVPDLATKWNDNVINGARFFPTGSFNMVSNLKNVGNTNITTPITVNGSIKNLSLVNVFTTSFPLATLAATEDTTFTYPGIPSILTPGEYYYESSVTNSQDINSGNNLLQTEVDMVNVCQNNFKLGYTSVATSNASINWNGGANDDGVAVHIIPPVYPVTITQMEVFVSSNVGNGLLAKIYADDGPGGTHGTLLYSGSISSASIITNAWNVHTITPVNINSGGFYIAFYQTGTNIFIGATTTGPLSRRNYEILDDGWADLRYNETQDLMIRCEVNNPNFAGPSTPGSITGPTSLCQGTTNVDYSIVPVSGATSYTWSLPPGLTGTSNSETISVSANAPPGGNIAVMANGICGSSTQATLNVTVHSLPVVTANATDDSLCTGDQTILTGGGASSYVWSGSVTDGIAFSPIATDTYSVIGTDANNCSDTTNILITVNALPTITASATDDTLCSGEQTTLTGSGANSYVWSGSVTDGISFTPGITDTYTVTGTDINNCSSTASILITVHSLPAVTANATDDTLCNGEPTILTGGGANSFVWSGSVNDGIGFTPAVTDTYTVTGTDANNCSNTASIMVVVNDLPLVTFNYPGNDTICMSYGVQALSGGIPSGGVYSGTGVSGTNFDPAISGTGSHTINYDFTDANGCSNSAGTDIVVLGCAGINSEEEISLTVYPNPFTDMITIQGIESDTQIELYNALGEVLMKKWISVANPVIETTDLRPGVYFLSVYLGGKRVTQKIVKR